MVFQCPGRLPSKKDHHTIMSKSRLEKTAVSISVITPLLGTLYAIYLLWGGWVGWHEIAILVGMYTTQRPTPWTIPTAR